MSFCANYLEHLRTYVAILGKSHDSDKFIGKHNLECITNNLFSWSFNKEMW